MTNLKVYHGFGAAGSLPQRELQIMPGVNIGRNRHFGSQEATDLKSS